MKLRLSFWVMVAALGLFLFGAAAAQTPQPFGLMTAVEITDFHSDAYGGAAFGKTVYVGPYFRLTDDLHTFACAEYGTNKTTGGKAEVIGGYAGAAWDIFDIYTPRNVEFGLLFEAGASNVDVSGFDPATNFSWVSGCYIKFEGKSTPIKFQLHARIVSVKDVYKPAIGFSAAVPFLLKR